MTFETCRGRRRMGVVVLALGAAALLFAPQDAPAPESGPWLLARPDYDWSFPRDHWSHPGYRIEWWYFTGELESAERAAPGASARRWGYQLTFFRVGLTRDSLPTDSRWKARNLIMGHAAIGDFARGRHRFSEVVYREAPLLGAFGAGPGEPIAWSRAPAGTDGRWTLEWTGNGFRLAMADSARGMGLALALSPQRALVFQGPGGYSVKGPGAGASQYYSFTRLDTEGSLTLDGRRWRVRGRSWMDREFGSNQLGKGQAGWDWFSLSLDDGRDLMIYRMRRADGTVDHASATLVSPRGVATYLAEGEWSVRATATWKSPVTGAVYPARWTIEIPGERLRLDVRPRMPDQENHSLLVPGLDYWEGAVVARPLRGARGGKAAGRGYVELTGYGEGSRPPF